MAPVIPLLADPPLPSTINAPTGQDVRVNVAPISGIERRVHLESRPMTCLGQSLRLPPVRWCLSIALIVSVAACGDDDGVVTPDGGDPIDATPAAWTVVQEDLSGALMSVWGSSHDDVWAVGADVGDGPMVLHFDGTSWTPLTTGTRGDLWWVFGFAGGPVYMGGKSGVVVRYASGTFTPLTTPTQDTIFGIWGASPSDPLWAVGGMEGGAAGGFAWWLDGDTFAPATGFPADVAASKAVWKVYGSAADDVWLVGTAGVVIHWNGSAFTEGNVGGGESLFTVHHAGDLFTAVGGFATDLIFENEGGTWTNVSLPGESGVNGVYLLEDGSGYIVGQFGTFMVREGGAWRIQDPAPTDLTLHAVWVDPDGGVWAVGGQVLSFPLIDGVLVYYGSDPPAGGI